MTTKEIQYFIFYGAICVAVLLTAFSYWYNETFKNK